MDKTKNLLEVRNLTVHYETDEGICEAVNDISFDIHPGEILGVVGETGAGKTTILQLIVRNYDIQKGQILIDGIDIRDIDIKCLRRGIGQMLQLSLIHI